MSFREKMHWASLAAILVGFGSYFVTLAAKGDEASAGYFIGFVLLVIGAVIVSMTAAAIVFAIANPREANAGEDERDKEIHRRSLVIPYYSLLVGAWCVGIAIHLKGLFFGLNALLALVVAVELLRLGGQIWRYRRGY